MASVNQNQGEKGESSSVAEELSRNLSLALMAATNSSNVSGGNQRQASPGAQVVSQQGRQSGTSGEGANDTTSTIASAVIAPQEISSSTETVASSSEDDAKPSTASSSSSPEQDDNSVTRKKAGKKDRSKLRKGKWTVEEEEYTTRIIHHFSTGLLTLPEGATLRSYLADKLNCDPMRITKKFAGASCLGRRVFHLRNRPQPSYEEIQMAKAELDQLEQRFRLRVEHGYGGMPLTNRPEMMMQFSNPSGAVPAPTSAIRSHASAPAVQAPAPNTNNVSSATATALLQNFAALATAAGANGNSSCVQLPTASAPAQSAATAFSALAGFPGAAQWLLPNHTAPTSAPAPSMDASVRAVNDAVTNWAWAQVAASLSNALPQLNAANLQQQQQLLASLSSVLPQLAAANLQQSQKQNNLQQQQMPQQQFFQQQQQQGQAAAAQTPTPSLQLQQQQPLLSSQSQQQPIQALIQPQQASSRPSFQSQKVLPKQEKDHPLPAPLQQKQTDNQNFLKTAHTDEANSFALQLRKAYEKQLKARQEAEKAEKSAEGTNKPTKPTSEKLSVEKKAKSGVGRSDLSQHPKTKPLKVSRSPKVGKQKEAGTSESKVHDLIKADRESRTSKQKEVLQPLATPAVNPPKANGAQDTKGEALASKRTVEDKEAGSILMGFLSSLRDSYEDALRNKKPATASTAEKSSSSSKKRARSEASESNAKKQKLHEAQKAMEASTQGKKAGNEERAQSTPLSNVVQGGAKESDVVPSKGKRAPSTVSAASSLADSYRHFTSNSIPTRRNPPNYITDMSTSTSETSSGNNSTNPVESSLEDSDSNSDKCGEPNSDKGKDNPSSSEEDNKLNSGRRDVHYRSKGPPRKRIKSKKMSDEMLRNQSAVEEKAAD